MARDAQVSNVTKNVKLTKCSNIRSARIQAIVSPLHNSVRSSPINFGFGYPVDDHHDIGCYESCAITIRRHWPGRFHFYVRDRATSRPGGAPPWPSRAAAGVVATNAAPTDGQFIRESPPVTIHTSRSNTMPDPLLYPEGWGADHDQTPGGSRTK
jgi:hypothetical protein